MTHDADDLSQAVQTRYAVELAEAALSLQEAYDLSRDEAIRQAIAACDGVQDTWTLPTAIART